MSINAFSIERTTGTVTSSQTPALVRFNDVLPFTVTLKDSTVANTALLGVAALAVVLRITNASGAVLAQCSDFVVAGGIATGRLVLGDTAEDMLFKAADGSVFLEFSVSEKTGPRITYTLASTISTAGGGEGIGDVVSSAPVFSGAVVTTANAMGALEIDTSKSLNTKTVTGTATLTASATPAASDTRSLIRLWNNSASASAITLPVSPAWFSEALQANITALNLPAGWRGEISWCYDGTRFLVKGDPVTTAQIWVAQTVATNALAALSIDWALGPSHSKTLAANSTFTFANAVDGQAINIAVTNTASNYTATWPTVQWAGGVAPTQTVGVKTDVYTFVKIGAIIFATVSQNHS